MVRAYVVRKEPVHGAKVRREYLHWPRRFSTLQKEWLETASKTVPLRVENIKTFVETKNGKYELNPCEE